MGKPRFTPVFMCAVCRNVFPSMAKLTVHRLVKHARKSK